MKYMILVLGLISISACAVQKKSTRESITALDSKGLIMEYNIHYEVKMSNKKHLESDLQLHQNVKSLLREMIGKLEFHDIVISKRDSIESVLIEHIVNNLNSDSIKVSKFEVVSIGLPGKLYDALLKRYGELDGIERRAD